MGANIALDDALIEQARQLGKHRTKRAAVTAALQEYVKRRQRLAMLEMVGKVEFWPDYDHKKLRRAKGQTPSATRRG